MTSDHVPVRDRPIRRWLAEDAGARLAARASHLTCRTRNRVTRRDERAGGEAMRGGAWRGRLGCVFAGNRCPNCPRWASAATKRAPRIGHNRACDRTRRTLHSVTCRGEAGVWLSWMLRGADWRRSHLHRCQSCRRRFADEQPGCIRLGEQRFPQLCRCDLGRGLGHTNCRASGPYCPQCAARIATEQPEIDQWEREWLLTARPHRPDVPAARPGTPMPRYEDWASAAGAGCRPGVVRLAGKCCWLRAVCGPCHRIRLPRRAARAAG
jgi:hypothetical protein